MQKKGVALDFGHVRGQGLTPKFWISLNVLVSAAEEPAFGRRAKRFAPPWPCRVGRHSPDAP